MQHLKERRTNKYWAPVAYPPSISTDQSFLYTYYLYVLSNKLILL